MNKELILQLSISFCNVIDILQLLVLSRSNNKYIKDEIISRGQEIFNCKNITYNESYNLLLISYTERLDNIGKIFFK